MTMATTARTHWAFAVGLLLVALVATGCGEAPSDEHVIDDPVHVEEIAGADVAHVTLTSGAARRLDITTAEVTTAGDMTAVPNAAVIVDEHGDFWVYTNPDPLAFERAQIQIDHEDAEMAYLTDGPPVGTQVVTLGAAELYGAERGIGH